MKHTEDDNGLDQMRNGEIMGMFLKVESTVFAEGWNVEPKWKREVKNDANIFGQSKWKNSISITYNRWELRILLQFSNKETTWDTYKSSSWHGRRQFRKQYEERGWRINNYTPEIEKQNKELGQELEGKVGLKKKKKNHCLPCKLDQ